MLQKHLKTAVLCCGLVALSACETSRLDQDTLNNDGSIFLEIKQPVALQKLHAERPGDTRVNALLASQKEMPDQEVRLVQARPAAIKADTKLLSVQLPDGQVVTFQQRRSSEKDASESYWFGDIVSDRKHRFPSAKEVDVDPMEWMSISRYGEQLLGSLHVRGNTYQLASLGDGRQLVIKSTRVPAAECEPLVENLEQGQVAKVAGKSNDSPSVVRVLVVSTNEGRLVDFDIEQGMKHVLETATSIYQGSGVNVRFEYAQHIPVVYSEATRDYDLTNILRDLRNAQHPIGMLVKERRDTFQADVVIVVSSQRLLTYGKAYIQARKETAFVIVPLFTYYGVGLVGDKTIHQLGHLFGAGHGWYPGDPIAPPPQYRNGYLTKTGTVLYRTIMAYLDCLLRENCYGDPFTFEVDHFSDSNAEYYGVKLGAEPNNNVVRLLKERVGEVSNFYP
ncbi:zinc-dependent metalloprotease family protein [Pseudomonas xantholysinigenes]|uniref:Uncharacterized protein n=1 Tax=Pseudomonas xantholysinigenes TaxID=2745490 RepID=A0A9E6PWL7_9PSED|nr:zinc-dependent metalloprotease family protein [Pseudomonas xantholysinigenes]QXI38820.1 hypothetical protein HU772_001620 [Pseudomonas xantholysinigenes]